MGPGTSKVPALTKWEEPAERPLAKESSELDNKTDGTKYDNFYSPKNNDFYAKFCYEDLNPLEHRIRLLRIHCSLGDSGDDKQSIITCDLLDNQSLAAMKGKFTTISYCAGDPHDVETIIVNGLEFNAFANLGHALRQARQFWREKLHEEDLLLWADQVCINQGNSQERSHQVNLMSEIYESGKQVLVSLSEEGDAFGGMGWLNMDWVEGIVSESYKCRDKDDAANDRLKLALEGNWTDKQFHIQWHALIETIFQSCWWSRAWIRQDFIRSPKAHFMASFEWMNWKVFKDLLDYYYYSSLGFTAASDVDKSCPARGLLKPCQVCLLTYDRNNFWSTPKRAILLLKEKHEIHFNSGKFPDLLENLQENALFCKASDPRDLIYAFIGVSSHAYSITPLYLPSHTMEDVLVQLARNVILETQNLGILSVERQPTDVPHTSLVPSWVPDWRQSHYKYRPRKKAFSSMSVNFLPDERGMPNRILQVRAIPVTYWLGTGQFKTDDLELNTWLFYGNKNFFTLQRVGIYYRIVQFQRTLNGGRMSYYNIRHKVESLMQNNDSRVHLISLC